MEYYLVFAGLRYYPQGGAGDLIFGTPNEEEAINFLHDHLIAKGCVDDWGHVYSLKDLKIIYIEDEAVQ